MQHRNKAENLNLPNADKNKCSYNPTPLHDYHA